MELIDIWNINRYVCKVLHNARIITLLRALSKLSPLEVKSFDLLFDFEFN